MNFWKICLLIFIGSSSSAQQIDRGYILFAIPGLNIQVPIDSISFNTNDEITIRAFGRSTEPSYTMVILSIVVHRLSTDLQDLNIKKCWLTLDHKNNFTDDFYLSFGFQDFFAFYSSQSEQGGDIKKIQAATSKLSISKIETMNSRIVLEGNFACSFINIRNGRKEFIEIQNGNFMFVAEQNTALATAKEADMPPASSDPYILPMYNFVVTPPLQSTPSDEGRYNESSLSLPDLGQSSLTNPRPASQPEPPPYIPTPTYINDNPPSASPSAVERREVRTGRGPADTNPAPARSDANSNGTRDSGVKRSGR